ncbi:MAG: cyclic peptide export ABC transporter [Deltaproteobacteria bacterium]|nr:cyclic peptide export ABC transporter [Deltaproteobacteria bacterium]
MQVLIFLVRSAPGIVVLASLASILSGALNTGLIIVVHRALTATDRISEILIVAFIGMVLGRLLSNYVSEITLMRYSQRSVASLRKSIISKLLRVPFRQFEVVGREKVYAALTADIETINYTLLSLPSYAVAFAVLLGGGAYLTYLSWKAMLLLAFLVMIGGTLHWLISKHASRFFEMARDQHDRLYRHFRALTEGTKELKLHRSRRRAFIENEVTETTDSLMNDTIRAHSRYFLARITSNFFFFTVLGLVIFLMPILHDSVSRVVSGYLLTCLYLMGSVNSLLRIIPVLTSASIAFRRVESLGIRLGAEGEEQSAPANETSTWKSIRLRGATMSYAGPGTDREFRLGPIDLQIRPKELLFITGGNGSGKTTLAKIITGLYQPEQGEILWDGKPVSDENRDSYRQLFSAVFSDFYLFESLLGLDRDDLTERARGYLQELKLDRVVGIRGRELTSIELSQGQKKRLALLTAFLEDRPVYLFDEWAADQDPSFKSTYYNKLIPELIDRGKTVIVITHDDRYFHLANRRIELQEGRIE